MSARGPSFIGAVGPLRQNCLTNKCSAPRWRQMIGNAIRVWRWAALLQLLCATAVTCAQAQPTAAGTDAQKSASPPSHGSYLGSQLIPHTGPDIRGKSATGTDTDHRLLLVIGMTKKVAAVTDVCGNGAQSSQRRVWQGHFRKIVAGGQRGSSNRRPRG